ncbi:hypothetical protein R3P38DRAFT_2955933 [Favolaschia claudopus]|uniref:DUF6697 domain-containing protein n=1 Tax=Favolaschia claudopus TaxID=2862362 RepID=A0AAW0BD20_9AGAR
MARRRIFMDAVIIPFDRTSRAHADAERQALDQSATDIETIDDDIFVIPESERRALEETMEHLKNPKVKKPKDALVLDLNKFVARLVANNISLEPYQVDLEPDIKECTVTRDFMSKTYGGSTQDTCPSVAAKFWRNTHLRNFMYLNLILNPQAPERPGAPGLLFNAIPSGYNDADLSAFDKAYEAYKDFRKSRQQKKGNHVAVKAEVKVEDEEERKINEDKTKILFSRLDANEWHYQGQYIRRPAPNLTLEEWKQQKLEVRKLWASKLKDNVWGRTLRANITLRRRLGRKPTGAEMNDALYDFADGFLGVTQDRILAAFNSGQAVIQVSTLQCVAYKADFQRNLAEKFPLYEPEPKADKETKAAARKGTAKPAKTVAGQKRKRVVVEDDSEDQDDNDSGDETAEGQVYRHRGTRSRPIVL